MNHKNLTDNTEVSCDDGEPQVCVSPPYRPNSVFSFCSVKTSWKLLPSCFFLLLFFVFIKFGPNCSLAPIFLEY